jgi:peptidoglycan/xylan/chitin deacetylase (PgdA/CDA1 family)
MSLILKFLVSAGICLLCWTSYAQQNQVCFTIDDLPMQRPWKYLPVKQKEITANILASLVKYKIPAIGFVNEDKLYIDGKLNKAREELLVQWLKSGMELGNHTFSHPDYNKLTFDAFSKEIIKGQEIIGELGPRFGKPIRYFRYPYLHRGNSEAKVDSVVDFLKSIHLIEAPVTIDNSEWVFASAYDSALTTKDTALLHTIGRSYISYMEDKVHYFESLSEKLFGRNIRQTLLIHANALNAEYLDELAIMFIRNKYSFVTLSEALEDEAYLTQNRYFGTNGISWMDRWALTKGYKGDFFAGEPTTPDFIKKLAKVKYE